jgi:SulP family sulfate permease
VIAIVVVIGIYDFICSIFIGIELAFVYQQCAPPILAQSLAQPFVVPPTQYRYLRHVRTQIHVTKLAGFLFFGTIVSVENSIRALVDGEAFYERPIRFLVFDLWHVIGFDYSAAEAFSA